MIEGEETLPMSLMDRISNTPVRVEPWIEYMLASERAHLKHWEAAPASELRSSVVIHIQGFIFALEDLQRKLPYPELWPHYKQEHRVSQDAKEKSS